MNSQPFQAGVLFVDGKAVFPVEVQRGFPVGSGFQGDLVTVVLRGDFRRPLQQPGSTS